MTAGRLGVASNPKAPYLIILVRKMRKGFDEHRLNEAMWQGCRDRVAGYLVRSRRAIGFMIDWARAAAGAFWRPQMKSLLPGRRTAGHHPCDISGGVLGQAFDAASDLRSNVNKR